MPIFGSPKLVKSVTLSAKSPERIALPTNGGTIKRVIVKFFKADDSATPILDMESSIDYITLEAKRAKTKFPILDQLEISDFNFLLSRYGAHRGLTAQDGKVMYDPCAVYAVDEYHRRTLALGTLDLSSMTLIVKPDAVLTNCARCEVYVIYDENDRQILGAHRRISSVMPALEANRTGELDNVFLPEYDGTFGYVAAHFRLPTDVVISEFSQKRNTTVTDFDSIPLDIFEQEDLIHRRTPVAGWNSIDYAQADTPTAFMRAGFESCQIVPNVTTGSATATSIKVMYEVIELSAKVRALIA